MKTAIWVIRGEKAGQLLYVTAEEAAQAEREGWGEGIKGKVPHNFSRPTRTPDENADAFFAKRSGYATRELRPADAPGLAAASENEDEKEAQATKQTRSTKRK